MKSRNRKYNLKPVTITDEGQVLWSVPSCFLSLYYKNPFIQKEKLPRGFDSAKDHSYMNVGLKTDVQFLLVVLKVIFSSNLCDVFRIENSLMLVKL
jgi:hypothetical protein